MGWVRLQNTTVWLPRGDHPQSVKMINRTWHTKGHNRWTADRALLILNQQKKSKLDHWERRQSCHRKITIKIIKSALILDLSLFLELEHFDYRSGWFLGETTLPHHDNYIWIHTLVFLQRNLQPFHWEKGKPHIMSTEEQSVWVDTVT